MPPCPAETTVWESMKAKNFLLSTLNNTRGWVSVVGTKGAGKTQRVLSTCHTLLSTSRNKDFVWVDFNGIGRYPQSIPGLIPCQPPLSHPLSHTLSVKSNLLDVVWVDFDCDFNNGIGSDMEAISRVVYQLGLRQVCKSSMSTRTKTKIFTHHPSSVPQSLSTTPHSYSIPTSSLLSSLLRLGVCKAGFPVGLSVLPLLVARRVRRGLRLARDRYAAQSNLQSNCTSQSNPIKSYPSQSNPQSILSSHCSLFLCTLSY